MCVIQDSKLMCTLCGKETVFYSTTREREYHKCLNCRIILMHPKEYVTKEEEKARYQSHDNNVFDPKYQQFVSPIVDTVIKNITTNQKGLDFGAGTGPVIAKMLRDQGFNMTLYDPFFWNDAGTLKEKYDFIVCCEVVEHFHAPLKEFQLMKSLLKEQGTLFIMTYMYNEETNFQRWFYNHDETHVVFYHENSFEWIKKQLGFKQLTIKNRLIVLSD